MQVEELEMSSHTHKKTITNLDPDSSIFVEILPLYDKEEGKAASRVIKTGE